MSGSHPSEHCGVDTGKLIERKPRYTVLEIRFEQLFDIFYIFFKYYVMPPAAASYVATTVFRPLSRCGHLDFTPFQPIVTKLRLDEIIVWCHVCAMNVLLIFTLNKTDWILIYGLKAIGHLR